MLKSCRRRQARELGANSRFSRRDTSLCEKTTNKETNMKTKTAGKKVNPKPVELFCHAPEAKAVFVAGTFNDWKPDATPLVRGRTGKWRILLNLAPGHHEFKFIVDNQWCCEPGCKAQHGGCPKCVPNDFGTMNRVLEVL